MSLLESERATLRRFGVKSLGLFGSIARDEAGPDSDLDLLVTLERDSFDDYMGLKLFLEDLFGRRVDLVLERTLKPRLRPAVMRDTVYAAGL